MTIRSFGKFISAHELIAKANKVAPFLAPQSLATFRADKTGELRQQPQLAETEEARYARLSAYGAALNLFPELVLALEAAEAEIQRLKG